MKKLVISVLCITFIFSGCRKDPNVELEGDRDILIYFTPQESLLKSVGTTQENQVNTINVYGVEDGGSADWLFNLTALPTGSGYSYLLSRKYTSLYAIANHGSLTIPTGSTTKAALENLTGSFASEPASPFLMSGIATNLNKTTKTVTIELVRVVAKVDINASGFDSGTAISVTVKSTPNLGYVFGRSPFAIPSGGAFAKIDYLAVSNTSASKTLYVAENVGATTPTQFLISGTVQGKSASHTFSLTRSNTAINIVRNTYCVVTVTATTHDNFTVNITVKAWDDVTNLDTVIVP